MIDLYMGLFAALGVAVVTVGAALALYWLTVRALFVDSDDDDGWRGWP